MREERPPEQELKPVEGRVPPNDLDAEGVVLSALLCEKDAFDRVAPLLDEKHFYSDANRLIYRCIKTMQEQGQLVDAVSIASYAHDKKLLDRIGGTPYLHRIMTAMPAAGAYLEQHVMSIVDRWRRRMVIASAQRISAEGYGDVGDTQAWIESCENTLYDIAHNRVSQEVKSIAEVAGGQFKKLYDDRARGVSVPGIETGFPKLDAMLSGLHPGHLYVIAGRPGMGKTVALTTILRNASRYDEESNALPTATCMFSLEQPSEQIAMRILCAEGQASFARMMQNHFHQDDYNRMNDALGKLFNVPMYIDDTAAITLLEIRAKARKLQRQIERGTASVPAQKLGVIGVDYVQLMGVDKSFRRKNDNREQEVSDFSKGLKRLAKELGVAVVALSQLNRKVEMRPDKRPQLSDLRESGAIEQDADAIIFLYRESYYKKTITDHKTEFMVEKQRNGPTGVVEVKFVPEYMMFRNLLSHEDKLAGGFDDYEVNPDGSF